VGTKAAEMQKEQGRWPEEESCCTPSWLPSARMNDALTTALRAWVKTDFQKEIDAQLRREPEWRKGPMQTDPCPSCHGPSDDYTPFDTGVWDLDNMTDPADLDESSKDDLARWLDEYSKSSTEEESLQASPGSSSDQYYYGRGGQYPTR